VKIFPPVRHSPTPSGRGKSKKDLGASPTLQERRKSMSAQAREMIRQTIFNLRYDMDCIGEDFWGELNALTDTELENILNDLLNE
jgi:hypothetical protein